MKRDESGEFTELETPKKINENSNKIDDLKEKSNELEEKSKKLEEKSKKLDEKSKELEEKPKKLNEIENSGFSSQNRIFKEESSDSIKENSIFKPVKLNDKSLIKQIDEKNKQNIEVFPLDENERQEIKAARIKGLMDKGRKTTGEISNGGASLSSSESKLDEILNKHKLLLLNPQEENEESSEKSEENERKSEESEESEEFERKTEEIQRKKEENTNELGSLIKLRKETIENEEKTRKFTEKREEIVKPKKIKEELFKPNFLKLEEEPEVLKPKFEEKSEENKPYNEDIMKDLLNFEAQTRSNFFLKKC